MALKITASPQMDYLAATDVLIGDMSSANYMFILMDKPVVLLANSWLRDNFPDIGIKTDLQGLSDALERSIGHPGEFGENRKYWAVRTIHNPDGTSCRRILDTVLERAGMSTPRVFIIHGNDPVRRAYLDPLYAEAVQRNIEVAYVADFHREGKKADNLVCISAHNADLPLAGAFNAHVEHGSKGHGTSSMSYMIWQYRYEHDYYPHVDLHITEGEVGHETTKTLLGPNSDRAVMAGSTVADEVIRLNAPETKRRVCQELGLPTDRPLVTYLSAGDRGYKKPGGSLSSEVLDRLRGISAETGYNVLVKLKYPEAPAYVRALVRLKKMVLPGGQGLG